MEKGFYHPDRGYWQTIGNPSADILTNYPEGTIEIPIKPGENFEWSGGAWIYQPALIEEPVLTQEDYTKAIQALLEKTALSRRYEQGATAFATYVNSKDAEWAAEAQAFVAWRDAVWRYAYQQLDAALAGEREQPTIEELLAELPKPTWPDAN